MPEKWKRCVDKVKKRGDAVNPYAVCTASTGQTRAEKGMKALRDKYAKGKGKK